MRFNQTFVAGRLTRDAELAFGTSGTAILKLRLAFDQGGKDDKDAGFVDAVMFGERGQKLHDWCKKGREVVVSGRLSYREWDDRNGGGKRSAHEIIAYDIEFTQPAPKTDGQQPQQSSQEGSFTRSNGAGAPPPGPGTW